jgi:outer membrane protein OmpA-like peptidoglycan-associated protein
MKINNNILALSSLSIVLLSSCVNYHTRKGNEYYDYLNFAPSIEHFEKAYAKNHDAAIDLKLADAYYKINKLDSAEAKYTRAIARGNKDPRINFEYGKVLMAQGKHMLAAAEFEKYLKVYPTDATAQMLSASCNSVIERYRDTTLYSLHPILEDQFVNTFSVIEYRDGAVFSADKKVFSGKKKNPWTGESYLDLYKMDKDVEGNWLNPELLNGDINGRFHEGPATFSKDGNTVYFTRSNYFKRKMVINEKEENNLKIFKASLINGEWKNLVEFPFNNDDYSCGHPTLTEDGKTMYFVSDMPGGLGGTDLYKTTLETDGNWSKPSNLGSEINTDGNEMFPYIHTDGSLYFSSDAHNSMGGLDVFITYNNGQRWMKPENLNYPLNSIKDDFGFSLNKDAATGFVSSSRSKTDKMYSFDKHPATFILYGKAREKGKQTPVEGVVIEITNAATGIVSSVTSDKQGNFNLKLAPESNYDLYCTKFGCFSKTDKLSTVGLKYSEDFFADFEVEPIVIDKPIVLENIYYDFDKWDIRQDAAIELDKLVRILKDNPKIEIEMGSHTDARGSDDYNMILSDKRAKAAVLYLISRGIDPTRLTWKGYGETVHINKCNNGIECTEEEHQNNRRTEFKVKKVRT